MEADILLRYKNKILTIDTKYYGHYLNEFFGTKKIYSQNLYQIFCYVNNEANNLNGFCVSGLLLYAQTEEKALKATYTICNRVSGHREKSESEPDIRMNQRYVRIGKNALQYLSSL